MRLSVNDFHRIRAVARLSSPSGTRGSFSGFTSVRTGHSAARSPITTISVTPEQVKRSMSKLPREVLDALHE